MRLCRANRHTASVRHGQRGHSAIKEEDMQSSDFWMKFVVQEEREFFMLQFFNIIDTYIVTIKDN